MVISLRKAIYLFVVVFIFVGFYIYYPKGGQTAQEEIHYHAGFRVLIDGKLQDYSDLKYMNLQPCSTPEHKAKEDDQMEKAHLHDGVGDVVHVHRKGALWGDLFRNIMIEFKDAQIFGYEDGVKIPRVLDKPIQPNESLIIAVGDQSVANVTPDDQVTLKHIEEVESKSETCGT